MERENRHRDGARGLCRLPLVLTGFGCWLFVGVNLSATELSVEDLPGPGKELLVTETSTLTIAHDQVAHLGGTLRASGSKTLVNVTVEGLLVLDGSGARFLAEEGAHLAFSLTGTVQGDRFSLIAESQGRIDTDLGWGTEGVLQLGMLTVQADTGGFNSLESRLVPVMDHLDVGAGQRSQVMITLARMSIFDRVTLNNDRGRILLTTPTARVHCRDIQIETLGPDAESPTVTTWNAGWAAADEIRSHTAGSGAVLEWQVNGLQAGRWVSVVDDGAREARTFGPFRLGDISVDTALFRIAGGGHADLHVARDSSLGELIVGTESILAESITGPALLDFEVGANLEGSLGLQVDEGVNLSPGTRPALVYPQLALGGGYSCVLLISNKADSAWSGQARLRTGKDQPWSTPWSLDGVPTEGADSFEIQLPAQGTERFVIASNSELKAGFLRIEGVSGASITQVATSFFYNFGEGSLIDSTAVAAASPASIEVFPVEKSGSVNTGLAWVASAPGEFEVQITLYDRNGTAVATRSEPYGGHSARFFAGSDGLFPEVAEPFWGKIRIDSERPLLVTALRLELTPAGLQLTSVPPDTFVPF